MFDLRKQYESPAEILRRLYNAALLCQGGPIRRIVPSMKITAHLCMARSQIVVGISTQADHDPPTIEQWNVVTSLLPEMNMPPPQRHDDEHRHLLYSIRNHN